MQTDIVRVKDLIELYPDDYKDNNITCSKCGGIVYSVLDVAVECENVVFQNGKIWNESPCNYVIMGG